MEKIIVKVQSFTDVITNSSSELFVVNTQRTVESFSKIWAKILKKHHKHGINSSLKNTYLGVIREGSEEGTIEINFSMCNVNDEAREELLEIFGKDNVTFKYN